MSEPKKYFDVAIIGHGPVGAALANILGQYDISTVILDRETSSYQLPRAVTFDDEVMRIFQSMGLSAGMDEITEVGGNAHFVDGDENILITWERPQLLSPNGWYLNYRFHQPKLEAVLRNGLQRFKSVTQYWRSDVIDLKQDTNGVDLRFRQTKTDEEQELRAAYVVGCDGARSFTRSKMNSEIEDLGFHEQWLIIDLVVKKPESSASLDSYHFCEPERSGTRVFVGRDRRRWEFRLNQDDDPDKIIRPENVWPLLERWIGPENADLERTTVYTFHSTIADSWRNGRLMIAGDAAHQTPPFMGQGMCAGIRDTANLGWKLERILKHDVDHSLLETYQTERKPHVRKFIELTIQMGQMINRTSSAIIAGNVSNPGHGPQKLNQLRPILGPGLSAGKSNLTGQLFPQPRLQSGQLLDDLIGNRPALILKQGYRSELSKKVECELANVNMAVVDDKSVPLQDWFSKNKVKCVSLRPDRYILGTANSESEILEIIELFRK